jgi:hypothetical protein
VGTRCSIAVSFFIVSYWPLFWCSIKHLLEHRSPPDLRHPCNGSRMCLSSTLPSNYSTICPRSNFICSV